MHTCNYLTGLICAFDDYLLCSVVILCLQPIDTSRLSSPSPSPGMMMGNLAMHSQMMSADPYQQQLQIQHMMQVSV